MRERAARLRSMQHPNNPTLNRHSIAGSGTGEVDGIDSENVSCSDVKLADPVVPPKIGLPDESVIEVKTWTSDSGVDRSTCVPPDAVVNEKVPRLCRLRSRIAPLTLMEDVPVSAPEYAIVKSSIKSPGAAVTS